MKSHLNFFWLLAFIIVSSSIAFAEGDTARAILNDSKGEPVAAAVLTQQGSDVKMVVEAQGLMPGKHGIHIHNVGTCTPPDFASAGPHLNFHGKQHGLDNPEGAHTGDLPNLEADSEGKAKTDFILKNVTLGEGENSLFHQGGTSVVIHAGQDDGQTDPAGNSGSRIACGVIEK